MSKYFQPASATTLLPRLSLGAKPRQEVLSGCLEAAERAEPLVHALAARVDENTLRARIDAARGPLQGMPMLVKDIFDTHDLPTEYGSQIYRGHRPQADAAMVSLLRRAGALVIGKSVTTEFAYLEPSVTRNPADMARTPGGSSSGSAAAVAAGYVPFAIGSQTGGSTIRPASYCGIAGYKPSFGVLPTDGMRCFSWSLDTVGLFAATARDLAYLASVLLGDAPPVDVPDTDFSFGVPEAYPWLSAADSALEALEATVRAIERAGGHVRRIRFGPWMESLMSAHATIQGHESVLALAQPLAGREPELSELLRSYLAQSAGVTALDHRSALAEAAFARQVHLPDLFRGLDAVLTPSAPDEAPLGHTSTGDSAFNRAWTLLGTPCVSVPGLRGRHGAPMGVQVIGHRYQDARTLAAATFVERALRRHAADAALVCA
jgi:Asp-tRNA(Asn)/Glu-tRNA(Gln) amidotransferase A subunit family amidase